MMLSMEGFEAVMIVEQPGMYGAIAQTVIYVLLNFLHVHIQTNLDSALLKYSYNTTGCIQW